MCLVVGSEEGLKTKQKHMHGKISTKHNFPLEESTNKPQNKEVNSIMWTLIETSLILLNYIPACTRASVHVPWLYFYKKHSCYFFNTCTMFHCLILSEITASLYTIRVKEGKGVGNQKHRNLSGLIMTRYDIVEASE